jgi:hypothetical protein
MAEVTYYVALPFVVADDGIAAGEPMECFNPNAAVMRPEASSRKEGHVGAVALAVRATLLLAISVRQGDQKVRRRPPYFVRCLVFRRKPCTPSI